MGAHVKAMYQELDGLINKIVTMLYTQWRPQLLDLEASVAALRKGDAAGPAEKARERMAVWLHMVS